MQKIVSIKSKWFILTETSNGVELKPLDDSKAYEVKSIKRNTRTLLQNSALHKYCALVAEALNDAGFSVQRVMENIKKAEVEWTMLSVKEIIWRNFQIALLEKKSTTELETNEVSKVYRNIDYWLSTKVGIESIPFPSIENIGEKQ